MLLMKLKSNVYLSIVLFKFQICIDEVHEVKIYSVKIKTKNIVTLFDFEKEKIILYCIVMITTECYWQ